MIITINVCDFCKNESEIRKGDTQLDLQFKVDLLSDTKLNSAYYNNKLTRSTFCGIECLVEYLRMIVRDNEPKKGGKTNE